MIETAAPTLKPLPFQQQLCAHIASEEPALWQWFASAEERSNYTESVLLELLKTTYRLDAETHKSVYDTAARAAARLQLEVPITVYQAQGRQPGMNAMLPYVPEAAHIVLAGPVLEALSEPELLALFGHELAHFSLFATEDGRHLVTDRIVNAMASVPTASNAIVETCRRARLYAEIYADRGALMCAESVDAVISCLVKVETGLSEVNAEAYLKQAREILGRGAVSAQGVTHPECYIRAHAICLWADEDPDVDDEVHRMIAGVGDDELVLDLLEQKAWTAATRKLLAGLLAPAWYRSDAVLAQGRSYFHDFAPDDDGSVDLSTLRDEVDIEGLAAKTYFSTVLLDFALVDRDIEDAALAACLTTADTLQIRKTFEDVAYRLGKVTKKRLKQVGKSAETILVEAGREGGADA